MPRPPGAPSGIESWRTGTWLDEYTPIYMALSQPGKNRGPMQPSEVDQLPIPMVGAFLGVGSDPLRSDDVHRVSAELNRQRLAAAQVAQEKAAAEGRHLTLAQAELEAGLSWQALVP